jgi:hypothetical protein
MPDSAAEGAEEEEEEEEEKNGKKEVAKKLKKNKFLFNFFHLIKHPRGQRFCK